MCQMKGFTGTDTELAAEGAILYERTDAVLAIDLVTVEDKSTQELRFSPGAKVCTRYSYDTAKLALGASSYITHWTTPGNEVTAGSCTGGWTAWPSPTAWYSVKGKDATPTTLETSL